MNPLMHRFETPFETVPFNEIKDEHFLPALHQTMEKVRSEIDGIKRSKERETFHNVIVALEDVFGPIDTIANIFINLNAADTSKNRQEISKEISTLVANFYNEVYLDDRLFVKMKKVYDRRTELNLGDEQQMLLERTYRNFVRNGAFLKDKEKQQLKQVDREIAENSLVFANHVLAETNSFELWVEDEQDLAGLPSAAKEAAARAAREKGEEGKWFFSLQMSSFLPFMKYLDNRELRERMYRGHAQKACRGNENDNRDTVKKIATLRHKRAALLGYKNHAEFVLEDRMAKNPDNVMDFLQELLEVAKPAGEREIQELQEFATSNDGPEKLQKWDYFYWAEKLKKERYHLDDEEVKAYFPLENVIEGAFEVANKLYGINFRERRDIPVYHESVVTYEVNNRDGQHLGVFYADLFPRSGKRSGAWGSTFKEQRKRRGRNIRPHVSLVMNFTETHGEGPSLLTFEEVRTFFHEFGHSLHALLSQCRYSTLSGTNVLWDFVELPSQLMENWCYEKDCLDLFAKHYETGEKIPKELVERLQKNRIFHEGRSTLRQVNLSLIDMAWHNQDPTQIEDVGEFEHEILHNNQLLPPLKEASVSCAFSHIFQGPYSAGYYSYKWAEVLEADAFELFKEKGIFDFNVSNAFLKNILTKGGSQHPMVLYEKFRGHGPNMNAFLARSGLVETID